MTAPPAPRILPVEMSRFVCVVPHGEMPKGLIALQVGRLHGIPPGLRLWACVAMPKRERPKQRVDQVARWATNDLARVAVLEVVRVEESHSYCQVVDGTAPPAGARCYVVEEAAG